jgi:hypothetical protein
LTPQNLRFWQCDVQSSLSYTCLGNDEGSALAEEPRKPPKRKKKEYPFAESPVLTNRDPVFLHAHNPMVSRMLKCRLRRLPFENSRACSEAAEKLAAAV